MLGMMGVTLARERVQATRYMMLFKQRVAAVDRAAGVLQRALDDALDSRALTALLRVVLDIGNFLNARCPRSGAAAGYRLEALASLASIRSPTKKCAAPLAPWVAVASFPLMCACVCVREAGSAAPKGRGMHRGPAAVAPRVASRGSRARPSAHSPRALSHTLQGIHAAACCRARAAPPVPRSCRPALRAAQRCGGGKRRPVGKPQGRGVGAARGSGGCRGRGRRAARRAIRQTLCAGA